MVDQNTRERIKEKWHLGNLPPAGDDAVLKFVKRLWDGAKKEKIATLGLHKRFSDLHKKWRGATRDKKYKGVGINPIFKTIHGHTAILTEKIPIAEIRSDTNPDDMRVKALDKTIQDWWVDEDEEQQFKLFISVQGMGIYGTTIEKGIWNNEKDMPEIIVRDQFGFFPAPGYKVCTIKKLPYCCDATLIPIWEIKKKFGLPNNALIPSNNGKNLLGSDRKLVRGGLGRKVESGEDNQGNYVTLDSPDGPETSGKPDAMGLVVEMWIKDKSFMEEPIEEEVTNYDDLGRAYVQMQQVGTRRLPNYLDGIRKITFCPDMTKGGILDDSPNSSVNWEMVSGDIEKLVKNGIEIPITNEMGQVVEIQKKEVSKEEAVNMVVEGKKNEFLWGRFPYSVVPSLVDTSQYWGFSMIEQIEEATLRAKALLKRYFTALDTSLFPTLINPKGSGIPNSKITNMPRQILSPTAGVANLIRFIDQPAPSGAVLEFIQFLLMQIDIASMSPEVTEGRRPKGISAASAIIALQEKAASLFQPQIRNVDTIIRNRGHMFISLTRNFSHKQQTINVNGNLIPFIGSELKGELKYVVESGSSAPITKISRRQQYFELYKENAMDLLSLLEGLEIPNPKRIIERLYAGVIGVEEAIKILISKGLPEDIGQQLYDELKEEEIDLEGGQASSTKTKQGAAPHKGASEGMKSAFKDMEIPGKNV